jgi:hypothetical protein
VVRLIVAVGVSAGLLWLVLRRVPAAQVGAALRGARPELLALGILVQCAIPLLSALRTHRIARALGLPLRYGEALQILLAANFYSLAVPGQLPGGVITVYRYRALGAQTTGALRALASSRGVELLAFAISGGVVWGALARPRLAAAIAFAGVLAGLVASRAMTATRLAAPLSAALIALVQVGVLAAVGSLFVRALGGELGYLPAVWISAAAYLASVLPISVAGIGVREGVLVSCSAPLGLSAEVAIAWGLLLLAGRLLIAAFGGALELTRFGARLSGTQRVERVQSR